MGAGTSTAGNENVRPEAMLGSRQEGVGRDAPHDSQAPPIPPRVRPYRHRVFSSEHMTGGYKKVDQKGEHEAEVESPEVVLLPNGGGLSLGRKGALRLSGSRTERYRNSNGHRAVSGVGAGDEEGIPSVDQDGIAAGAGLLREARSASSLYPSEMGDGGFYSSPLTVSPPLTFGRRILSSLGGLRFSSASGSSLRGGGGSEGDEDMRMGESSSREDPIGGAGAVAGLDGTLRGLTGNGRNEIVAEEVDTEMAPVDTAHEGRAGIGGSEVISGEVDTETPMDRVPESFKTLRDPLNAEQDSSSDQDGSDCMNISTQCLPRTSINPDARTQQPPPDRRKRLLPRRTMSKLANRLSDLSVTSRPAKVKKWVAHKFRTSRKRSRALLRRLARARKNRRAKKRGERNKK